MAPDVSTVDIYHVFRFYSTCKGDPRPWVLDVRSSREFKKSHLSHAYSIRLTADERALLDYSKNQYEVKWTDGCWWGKQVFVYGTEDLKKDHPVVEFLLKDGRAEKVMLLRNGFEAIRQQYPFLVTASVKENALQRPYPAELVPSLLYLGDWDHASDQQQLKDINVRGIITIHNHPENLRPPQGTKHLKLEAPDIESHDISQHFPKTFDFVEDARRGGYAVLVHCGAGVSRSAALCIAYLMRKNLWSLQHALQHTVSRRSLVLPNEGFMRCLMALEGALGLGGGQAKQKGFADNIAGEKVVVTIRKDEGEKDEERLRGDGGREPVRERESCGDNERGRERGRGNRDRESEPERERSYRGREPERERSGSHREREVDREPRHRQRDKMTRQREAEGRVKDRDGGETKCESPPQERKRALEEGSPAIVLEVLKEGKIISKVEIPDLKCNQRCIFGRAPTCDIKLDHLSISRQHAQMTRDDAGMLYITDLNTSHGTNVDDAWLRPNTQKQISPGTIIRFGASTRSFRVSEINFQGKRQRAK